MSPLLPLWQWRQRSQYQPIATLQLVLIVIAIVVPFACDGHDGDDAGHCHHCRPRQPPPPPPPPPPPFRPPSSTAAAAIDVIIVVTADRNHDRPAGPACCRLFGLPGDKDELLNVVWFVEIKIREN
jgi:hypothetical protein